MKKLFLFCAAVMTLACCQAAQKVDEFTTKSGKKVTITCIKHASMEINYNGTEIQVDPVGFGVQPTTDYNQFPKANIILITHEHKDHFDREAITCVRTPATRSRSKLFLPTITQKVTHSSIPKVAIMAISSPSMDCASILLVTQKTSQRWRPSKISTSPSCLVTNPTR